MEKKFNSNIQSKIVSLGELEKIVHALKKKGKIIVHCHGVFDLLHPGHILHFGAAKQEGDILIVTLPKMNTLGKAREDPFLTKDCGRNPLPP